MRLLIKSIFTVVVVVLYSFQVHAKKGQPNFLIILGDDISAYDFGCYGSQNPHTSPNIDQLAKEGVRFTNMFVSEAMCAPTRAELYTGLQPQRNGCYRNHMATNEGTLSIVQHLETLGYRVGLTGKTHFKPKSVYPFEIIKGFEPGCTKSSPIRESWEGVEEFVTRDKDQPFCLVIASIHAHAPWEAGDTSPWELNELKLPPHLADTKETRRLFREYLAEIRLFDEQVGKTQFLLDEHDLDKNTVLIVLDENGAGMPGGKWTVHDWGVRSACVMKWPKAYKANFETDVLAQYCDILPTLIDAAGGEVPDNIDGKSLLPLIKGETKTHRDKAYFVYNSRDDAKFVDPHLSERAVCDGRYKLIWNMTPGSIQGIRSINGFDFGFAKTTKCPQLLYRSWLEQDHPDEHTQNMVQRYKYHPEYQLFDLDKDPYEMNNLANDPQYASKVDELKSAITDWMTQQEDDGHLLRNFHVAKNGSDKNTGTVKKPLLTIQAAANLAQPGNTIIVHEGVYRESINPKHGGYSDERRIVYKAAEGEKVIIKGSEIIKGWENVEGDIWNKKLPNKFFGEYNPYSDTIGGHWYFSRDKNYHTGAVYLNGKWLKEATSEQDFLSNKGEISFWFAEVDDKTTTIRAQFPGVDPNEEEVEINVRQTIFFPEKTGLNYITIRGFTMQHAATNWAAPTQVQKGLLGPNWAKGWIIEDNMISYSKCVGICLGREEIDTLQPMNAPGMIAGFQYASEHGIWNKDIGHHTIRNNRIQHCGQAGIVGNMGAAFSLIEGNEISDINVNESFDGFEQGGIKLHGGVDVIIQNNCVYHIGLEGRGIWLDWLGQGAIIRNNLIFDTDKSGLYLEVNHGPILVANNIILSSFFCNRSRGSALVHNLFDEQIAIASTIRITPYLEPHSVTIAGMNENFPGDDRFYNNIFAVPNTTSMAFGESRNDFIEYENQKLPLKMRGNLHINDCLPYKEDARPMVMKKDNINLEIIEKEDGFYIEWANNPAWTKNVKRDLITTDLLGKAIVPNMKYENPDGSPIAIDTDYFGNPRNKSNPAPGPFEGLGDEKQLIKIWTKK
ncbi:MAG: sulfatase-like hydrolase/transferase [Bacteroidales bacterium]|nr:sulfatase-like hydrolase/transferase [Bacteroidales bacterium]